MQYARRDNMGYRADPQFVGAQGAGQTNVNEKGERVTEEFKGDISTGPHQDVSRATLRPQYGVSGADQAIPDPREQLRSDLEFDLFSVVPPGYGEGVDNKLYLYQKAHEDYVRFQAPFFSPGPWLGPLNTLHPMPWQWQSIKSSNDINNYRARIANRQQHAMKTIREHDEKSTWAFGRDVPQVPTPISSCGLKRSRDSVFEPVIHNKQPWTPYTTPAGVELNRMGTRKWFDPWREPQAMSQQPENGGPTLRKRRALEVILP